MARGNWMERGIFEQEVLDKKREAYTRKFNKTGARGGSRSRKGVRTPSDFLSKKEMLQLNGEVRSHNMYETILNWNDFELKDKETQKNLLTRWREIYPNSKIMDELSIGRAKRFNTQSFADIVNGLGCPPKVRGQFSGERKPRKAKVPKVQETPKMSLLEFAESEPEKTQAIQEEVVKAILISKGLHLEYNGDYDVEALNRLFTKLQLLVDGEPSKYKISLSLTEIVD
jgi:hypothetical protein